MIICIPVSIFCRNNHYEGIAGAGESRGGIRSHWNIHEADRKRANMAHMTPPLRGGFDVGIWRHVHLVMETILIFQEFVGLLRHWVEIGTPRLNTLAFSTWARINSQGCEN
jgi:hypothetical protein